MHARVLKFHVWISHEKIADAYFLPSGLCSFSELWPFEEIWIESCQQSISKTIEARAMEFKEEIGSDAEMTSLTFE